MKVGVSHLIAGGTPLDQFFKASAEAGYEVVELCVRRSGEVTPETTKDALKEIKKSANDCGLTIDSVCHSHITGNLLASGDAQKIAIEETKIGLEIAAELGAYCTLHTLGGLNPDLYYDEAYKNGIASLKAIAPTAEKLNVDLAVEFVWNGFLFSPLEMRNFLNEVGSNAVGFYFDPGNMAVFQFPQHWARILGKHIKMVHMKDWKGNALNGSWPALLEGNVNFPVVMRELASAGYNGPLISEVPEGDAPLKVTAESIRKIMKMADA
ncbi:TPA: sugar phosphate isomerase/epimerase [bacterium]|nr:sugar phosphate isomerase/epimerase [bacterium]